MKSLKLLFLSIIIFTFLNCTSNKKIEIDFISTPNNPYPFSKVVKVDNLLFLAGQIGKNPETGKLIEDDIAKQTAQVFKNIEAILKANGSDLDHVVKSTVILSDINNFGAMNEVYKTFFKKKYPARTTFQGGLVGNALIEIEVIAVKK